MAIYPRKMETHWTPSGKLQPYGSLGLGVTAGQDVQGQFGF